jgi:thiol-disulfide isomerase/thioredoxin
MASEHVKRIEEAAAAVRARTKLAPRVGIVLGSGLGDFADALEPESVVPFAEIPHFPVSTVESHAGELHLGRLAGKPVAVHFHADWCPTCKLQEKALAQLKAEPGLDLTVLVADYDKEKDLKKAMKVRTQSTLVVFKGSEEKARLAGDTAADKIRTALKAAL